LIDFITTFLLVFVGQEQRLELILNISDGLSGGGESFL